MTDTARPSTAAEQALNSSLGFLLQRAHQRLRDGVVRALEGSGLNPGQLAILGAAFTTPGVSQRELVAATGVEKSSMVIFLDRLEGDGWGIGRPHPATARPHAVGLTAEGAQRLAALAPRLAAAEAEALAGLGPDDKQRLIALLQR